MSDNLGVFFGGPDDGKPVVLQPGWPRPDVIGHRDWPRDGYLWNYHLNRFEWKQGAMRGSASWSATLHIRERVESILRHARTGDLLLTEKALQLLADDLRSDERVGGGDVPKCASCFQYHARVLDSLVLRCPDGTGYYVHPPRGGESK